MLALARALLGQPRLLIVDEMSLGLAPVVVRRLLPVLREIALASGVGVLFVEQNVYSALEIADRAYVMSRGKIALNGTGADLLQRRELIAASYLGVAAIERDGGQPKPETGAGEGGEGEGDVTNSSVKNDQHDQPQERSR
jgi:branched-chain amino acid transport system ATP-binding protein